MLSGQYDFITCTEAAEHFYDPGKEFQLLANLLRPKGWLGLMTKLYSDEIDFTSWYYRRDPTHVCFYQRETMAWLAQKYFWQEQIISDQVILFKEAAVKMNDLV